jgi:hypothetical protein
VKKEIQYETEYYIGTDQREIPLVVLFFDDLFWKITRMNDLLEVKYYDDDAPREYRYETRIIMKGMNGIMIGEMMTNLLGRVNNLID